ncbi:DUF484 family protein [Alteromonas oceanisediminis]|uniref:DUF484 family protein n=1 Tax=Alteromonas oceanisediminis TaxID=2836180 RepID=UPI001BDB4C0B|nr:DUF484 family protein [Alteromonas oceanisediminis]MBT0586845.1 DUF484 family protein [Alteromonas oceanisediminis]
MKDATQAAENQVIASLAEQQLDVPPANDESVRAYLLQNPDFFSRCPELLEKLVIPHERSGSVSLVEKQSEILRNKVRQLSRKIHQLIAIAKQNERIYRVYVDLNLRLWRCTDFEDIQNTLEQVMLQQLKLSAVAIKPFKGPYAMPEIQQRLFIEKHFKNRAFYFGRLTEHEKHLLFDEQTAQSCVLVRLGVDNDCGILAVGSNDPGHFNPDMDTLLLTQLQQFLNILLPDILGA